MIQSKHDYNYFLKQDKIANSIKDSSNIVTVIKNLIFPNPIWLFIKTLRRVEYYNNCKITFGKLLLIYYRIKLRNISVKLGFSIPINVFGPGLSIPHYGTIVVNPNARVGKNCRLHVGVNIGASAGNNKAPIIGDNSYIGPGAILFGDIKIGNNVTIGANSTVNKSHEKEFVVLAGSPATIVKENFKSWIEFNKINL